MKTLFALLSGLVFGLGLILGGMTNPLKVAALTPYRPSRYSGCKRPAAHWCRRPNPCWSSWPGPLPTSATSPS